MIQIITHDFLFFEKKTCNLRIFAHNNNNNNITYILIFMDSIKKLIQKLISIMLLNAYLHYFFQRYNLIMNVKFINLYILK